MSTNHSQNYSLFQKAQEGDLEALKKLINNSYSSQGITVKYIQLLNGEDLEVEIRSVKGFITQDILEEITQKVRKVNIPAVKSVNVVSSKPIVEAMERETRKKFNDDKYVAILGAILFLLGLFMMIVGLSYDNDYKGWYNIGAISNKASWINVGGFLTVSGSVFLSVSYRKLM